MRPSTFIRYTVKSYTTDDMIQLSSEMKKVVQYITGKKSASEFVSVSKSDDYVRTLNRFSRDSQRTVTEYVENFISEIELLADDGALSDDQSDVLRKRVKPLRSELKRYINRTKIITDMSGENESGADILRGIQIFLDTTTNDIGEETANELAVSFFDAIESANISLWNISSHLKNTSRVIELYALKTMGVLP